MNIIISNADGKPIYEQIAAQIKHAILTGELQPGEMLPSIRALARDLRISVITTKRAYEELEKEGFLYTVPAKGCYVAPRNVELLREENLRKMEWHIDEALRLGSENGLGKAEILETIRIFLEEQP